jgi:hypothetical protein
MTPIPSDELLAINRHGATGEPEMMMDVEFMRSGIQRIAIQSGVLLDITATHQL